MSTGTAVFTAASRATSTAAKASAGAARLTGAGRATLTTFGAGPSGIIILTRRPVLQVWIDDVLQTGVAGATMHFGWRQRYATAEVRVRSINGITLGYWSKVEISAGASTGGVAPRFFGYILQTDNPGWPASGILRCRGPLGIAAALGNYATTEIVFDSLYGTDLSNMTDQAQANAILTAYGLSGRYTYPAGTLGGTGATIGNNGADEACVWRQGQSGLDYLDALDEACAAQDAGTNWGTYRTFETVGGEADKTIFRTLVTGNPQAAPEDADFTFTEGVDLLGDLHVTHDPTQVANAITVRGHDDGLAMTEYTIRASSPYLPAFMPNAPSGYPEVALSYHSPFLERATTAEAGSGLACEAKARQLLADRNTEVVTVRASTYRDDVFGPGQTHYLGAPVRLGVFQNMVCQQVTIDVSDRGVFRQRLEWMVKN